MITLEIISVNIWNIIFALSNLLIMFLVVKKFLFARVQRVMEERKEAIDGDYNSAQQFLENARDYEKGRREMLENADAEAEKRIKEGEKRAFIDYEKILAEAGERAHRITERAKLEAKAEFERSRREIKGEIAEISAAMVEKLLEHELSSADHSHLVDKVITRLEMNDDENL